MQWIRGHQDNKQPYEKLSLPAQLNCDADSLADDYFTQNPAIQHAKAPILPTTGCQLHLYKHGTLSTITRKLKRELRIARTAPALKNYLIKKFEWTETIWQDINHKAFSQALNKQAKHYSTILKHVNRINPVGRRVHKYDKKYPPNCPSCDLPEEHYDHVWKCTGRQPWKRTFQQQLRKGLQAWKTPPALLDLILALTAHIVEGTDLPDSGQYPEELQEAWFSQQLIGFDNMMRARLTQRFTQYIDANLEEVTKTSNGQTWTTNLADMYLQGYLMAWQARNDDRHGHDAATKQAAAARQAVREIQQLYEMKDEVLPEFQYILDQPIETVLRLKANLMRCWINTYKSIMTKRTYNTALTAD